MSNSKSPLSLCMIVKNEANFLRECLLHAAPYCNKLIVVDTGSADDSRRIALDCGAELYDFDWVNDFSKARNYAISKTCSDWVIMLDADERINKQGWELILKKISETSSSYFDLPQVNYVNQMNVVGFVPNELDEPGFSDYKGYSISWLTRLFRTTEGYFFSGAVHEHLCEGKTILSGERLPAYIHHHGQVLAQNKMLEKKMLYLNIGKEKVQQNPSDSKSQHELGIACWEMGDMHGAQVALEASREFNPKFEQNLIALGTVYQLQKKYHQAEDCFQSTFQLNPRHPNIHAALARLYQDQDQISKAIEEYKMQIRANPDFEQARLWLSQAYVRLHEIEPGAPASISVCYIVKNESDCIGKSIDSVKDYADEVIVLDTGSTDNTIDVARRRGAFIAKSSWCDDFAWARNQSLKHATSEWILVLDADEVLSRQDWKQIKDLLLAPKAAHYSLIQTTYSALSTVLHWKANDLKDPEAIGYEGYFESSLVRFFRNTPQIKFIGSVHEHAYHENPSIKPEMTSIRIHHYGKQRDEQRMQSKSELYHRIGLKKLSEMPQEPHAYYEMAVQYWEMKDVEHVEKFFKKALELNPHHEDASVAYACFLHEQKRYADSLDQFIRVISVFPKNAEAHLFLSSVLVELEKCDLAIQMMTKARELGFSNEVSLSINEGVLWLNVQNYEQAEACFQRAYQINPNFSTVLINLAIVMLKTKRYSESEKYLNKLLLIDRKNVTAYKLLAETCFQKNDIEHSLQYFLKALELSPDNEEIMAQVIIAAHCLNNMDLVKEYESKFFSLNRHQNFTLIVDKLKNLYRQRGDGDGLGRLVAYQDSQSFLCQ